MDMKLYTKCLVDILKCSISNTTYKMKKESINLAELRNFAKYHEIDAFLYPALKDNEAFREDNAYKDIFNDFNVITVKYANQEYYIEQVRKALNKENIKYVFLKGSVLRGLYPIPELRQSADIDIYFDEAYAKRVKDILCNMGFANEKFGSDQDVYILPPYVCIEMHRMLLPPRSKQFDVGITISKRLIHKSESEYIMSNEDFYIFHIIHTAKHMSEGGIGIRAFFDMWIYLRAYNDKLDWEFIEKELENARLLEFEKHIKCLALHWFEDAEKGQYTDEIENYVIYSGWNGTHNQKTALMSEEYVKDNKMIYYFKYIFKSVDELKTAYPYLKKNPMLYPIAFFDRIYKLMFVRKGAIRKFLHRYDDIDMRDIDDLKSFVKRIGL